eukprot:m.226943 g.226943  ORF g.226943 m.226943 type:complete len:641 (-) comp15967_c0_seq8:3390-5312(-)
MLSYVLMLFVTALSQDGDVLSNWRGLASSECSSLQTTSTELGNCPCDLQAKNCDPNCCCDSDCSTEDQEAFTDCYQLPSPPNHRACVYDEIITRENTQETVERTDDGLFCVIVDNNEERFTFEPQCAAITDNEFEELLARAHDSYSFGENTESVTRGAQNNVCNQFACRSVGEEVESPRYQVGRSLLVVGLVNESFSHAQQQELVTTDGFGPVANNSNNTNTSTTLIPTGYLTIAQDVTSGECVDFSPAGYLQDEEHTCTRSLLSSDVDDGPCSRFSFESATIQFYRFAVANRPSAETTSAVPLLNYIKPTCYFSYEGNSTILECSNETLQLLESGSKCHNIVSKVKHYFSVSEGVIEDVVSLFTLRIIDEDENFGSLRQEHVITFSEPFDPTSDGSIGLNEYPRSGNPGYLIGKPVLAGNLGGNSENVTINLNLDSNAWLVFPKGEESGLCPNVVDMESSSILRSRVDFGYDLVSSCSFSVSTSNFTQCDVFRQNVNAYVQSILSRVSLIGRYGNSSQTGASDWVEILSREIPSSIVESATDSGAQCAGILTGIHLKILTADIGADWNPQATIVGARFSFTLSTVQLLCPFGKCSSDFEQLVTVQFSVGYTDVTEKAKEVLYQAPSVVHDLPDDFWHPF